MGSVTVVAKGLLHIVIGCLLTMNRANKIMKCTNRRSVPTLLIEVSRVFFPLYLCFFAFSAHADVFDIHFFYDVEHDQLTVDSHTDSPVSVDKEQDMSIMGFLQNHSDGEFEIVFVYVDGYEGVRAKFSPEKGSFVFQVPYLSLAKEFKVYKSGTSEPLFSYDLRRFSTCNKNGVCEYEKGENFETCLPDCVGITVNFSDETKKLLKQNNDVIRDPKTGEVILRGIQATPTPVASPGETAQGSSTINKILLIIGAGAVVLISIGVFAIIRLRARHKKYGL